MIESMFLMVLMFIRQTHLKNVLFVTTDIFQTTQLRFNRMSVTT